MDDRWISDGLRAVPPLRFAVRRARAAVAPYRLRAWTLEGRTAASGGWLRLVYAGQLEAKNYFAHLAFAEPPFEREQHKHWAHQLLRRCPEDFDRADLLVVDVAQSIYRRFCGSEESRPHAGAFCLPCWVKGEIALPTIAAQAKPPETVRSDLRLIARNRLRYRVTRDPAAFESFYRSMYLPYITTTYAGRAFLMSYDDMRRYRAQSELVLITRNDEDIAGQIVAYRDGRAYGWSTGVKDGDATWVSAGALAALYHFVPQYLSDKGYASLDVGLSRPFLKDGVLQYKKKWGLRITAGHEKLFVLKFARGSTAARAFLRDNPFIYLSRGQLQGAAFVAPGEESQAPPLARLRKHYLVPGLSCLNLYALDNIHAGAQPIGALFG